MDTSSITQSGAALFVQRSTAGGLNQKGGEKGAATEQALAGLVMPQEGTLTPLANSDFGTPGWAFRTEFATDLRKSLGIKDAKEAQAFEDGLNKALKSYMEEGQAKPLADILGSVPAETLDKVVSSRTSDDASIQRTIGRLGEYTADRRIKDALGGLGRSMKVDLKV